MNAIRDRKQHEEAVKMNGLRNLKISHKLIGGFLATSIYCWSSWWDWNV